MQGLIEKLPIGGLYRSRRREAEFRCARPMLVAYGSEYRTIIVLVFCENRGRTTKDWRLPRLSDRDLARAMLASVGIILESNYLLVREGDNKFTLQQAVDRIPDIWVCRLEPLHLSR
jgi:hypothetical protein